MAFNSSMAPSPKVPLLILIIALSWVMLMATSESNDERVSELLSLQSRSKSGVIRLNDQSLSRFLTSVKTPRPYSILLFFDAVQLHDKAELRLTDLRNEFSIVSSSFIANNIDNPSHTKLFFCDIEFKESQLSFSQFSVNALPHIRLVGPNHGFKDSEPMDQSDFSRLAESMADFVEAKTKLSVGPIHRPPVLSRNHLIIIGLAILIWLPFFIKKVLSGQTLLHDPRVWLAGSVFVYFFSVSGAMHNIIRKMPMFLVDRNDPSKLVFFYQGSGMQLGAEGFTVGFLYTVVGLLLAFMTHGLVKVSNVTVQRVIMIFALLVSFLAVKQVVHLDNWKTGYGIHGFWPSSWN
ncbi:probable dolichyl-diphosphooligosaccharide--protein glycosyltransferase subunit 3B [Gastrolobium bilobum]|uniref:probable dolichyl-diphosphooligosaccharide--protein glycosyltransferase subunit 3B n=1 Tax=Gastrolobium bilobum TaxID=150636 RepID=UPI002AAFDA8A|nr:probable dolichyl-diphosphooligosaccharide--protein glycosyltransferase subunit 3B [Gastrolobium bilobum]